MIIDACEDRLYVISDLHLGNPSSTARGRLVEFLDYAAHHAHECVHQRRRLRDAADELLAARLRCRASAQRAAPAHARRQPRLLPRRQPRHRARALPRGLVVHPDRAVPQPAFRRRPHPHRARPPLRPLVRALPEGLRARRPTCSAWRCSCIPTCTPSTPRCRNGRPAAIATIPSTSGRPRCCSSRGFDTVIFGHTHNALQVELPRGQYVNSGNWLRGSSYVEIDNGKVELKRWESWATR